MERHVNICHRLFENICKQADLYLKVDNYPSETRLDEPLLKGESFNDNPSIHISLLTDEIIAYDEEIFKNDNHSNLIEGYRPYFISFIVSLENSDAIKHIESLSTGWYCGKFVPSTQKYAFKEDILINGVLETSASPVNHLEGSIIFFKNKAVSQAKLNQINNLYNPTRFSCTNDFKIEQLLNDTWENDSPVTIDIYNVGHGNADYIRGKTHRILYDIGYNYRSFPHRHKSHYLRAANAIRHLKPSCVILSHWDMDHIIGCAYAEQNIFAKAWIAPNLISTADGSPSINAIRIAKYLDILGNLYLVERNRTVPLIATVHCSSSTEIKLWMGIGKSCLTPRNCEGIMLEMTGNSTIPHILLAGDVPYNCMPPAVMQRCIDFMHVPHHCSKMELDKLRDSPSWIGICAIISTNRKKNKSLNADSEHHDELSNIRFKDVLHTIDNLSHDDEKNLSIQINCTTQNICIR